MNWDAFLSLQHQVCTPNVKATYGAWYLDPKTWKKRPVNEPLRDTALTEDLEHDHQPSEKVGLMSTHVQALIIKADKMIK